MKSTISLEGDKVDVLWSEISTIKIGLLFRIVFDAPLKTSNSNPSTSSNINLPSTITVFKIGVDISNKIFYPAGILTTFPSVGGLPPPHVVYYDHLSIYK